MSGRGGKRKGAGRKPNALKAYLKLTAGEILASVDEVERWKHYIHHYDPRIAFDALKYLTDRRDGKPAQAVMVSGNPDESTPVSVVVDV